MLTIITGISMAKGISSSFHIKENFNMSIPKSIPISWPIVGSIWKPLGNCKIGNVRLANGWEITGNLKRVWAVNGWTTFGLFLRNVLVNNGTG